MRRGSSHWGPDTCMLLKHQQYLQHYPQGPNYGDRTVFFMRSATWSYIKSGVVYRRRPVLVNVWPYATYANDRQSAPFSPPSCLKVAVPATQAQKLWVNRKIRQNGASLRSYLPY